MQLVNFTLGATSAQVWVAGRVVDLHDAPLQGYHYATEQQRLTLHLQGQRQHADTNIITTDVRLVFDHVTFVRLQQSPSADDAPVLVALAFVDAMTREWQTSTLVMHVSNLFSTEEIDELGVQDALFISFWGGMEMLIGAATATLFFAQANTIEA